jgi:hypothetical protein
MQADRHEPICHIIDKSLLGAASLQEERTLREHLPTCTSCTQYLEASNRAIASLGGFSFEVDPGLHEKVLASFAQRQLETKWIHSMSIWWSRLIALVLTVAGSFVVSQFADRAAVFLHLAPGEIQLGLVAFWIAPSVCFCLLLLLLPASPANWINTKGLSK